MPPRAAWRPSLRTCAALLALVFLGLTPALPLLHGLYHDAGPAAETCPVHRLEAALVQALVLAPVLLAVFAVRAGAAVPLPRAPRVRRRGLSRHRPRAPPCA